MNLTIKNKASGTRSYLSGIVTVSEESQATISRDLNVIIVQDAQFLTDFRNNYIIINNGIEDLSPSAGLKLIEVLAQFSTDRLATLFLYYSVPFRIVHTSATSAGATVFAMRNSNPLNWIAEDFNLNMEFSAASPLGAAAFAYEIVRFDTATQSGGTSITPSKMSTLAPASGLIVNSSPTGLTTTGMVFGSVITNLSCSNVRGDFFQYIKKNPTKLAPGEGIAIRLLEDSASGLSLTGDIVGSLR